MRFTRLGKTELNVSVLALGCWPFAGGAVWGPQNRADAFATVHAALDAGINLFDTAYAYESGESERVLGAALGHRRDEAIIATKLGGSQTRPDLIREACKRSLDGLNVDCIDLYQVHWPSWSVPTQETVDALQELRNLGWIRYFSVCNYGTSDLADINSLVTVPSDQLPYSLLWRVIEREILPLCQESQTGIICYSPLMQGLLTGRYKSADEVPEGLARTRLFSGGRPLSSHGEPGCETAVFAALAELQHIARRLLLNMAALSLAWVLHQPGVASVLIGARSPRELDWNLPALEISLSAEVQQELRNATTPVLNYLGTNPDMWLGSNRMR